MTIIIMAGLIKLALRRRRAPAYIHTYMRPAITSLPIDPSTTPSPSAMTTTMSSSNRETRTPLSPPSSGCSKMPSASQALGRGRRESCDESTPKPGPLEKPRTIGRSISAQSLLLLLQFQRDGVSVPLVFVSVLWQSPAKPQTASACWCSGSLVLFFRCGRRARSRVVVWCTALCPR